MKKLVTLLKRTTLGADLLLFPFLARIVLGVLGWTVLELAERSANRVVKAIRR